MNEIRVHVVEEKDRPNLAMRYRDPITGKHVKRSAGTSNRKEALKKAAQWEAEINEGRYQVPNKITWNEFRARFEAEKLADPNIAAATRETYATAFNHVERVLDPDRLSSLTTEVISQFVRLLRKPAKGAGMKESTIACHLRHLKAALRWAARMGLLAKAPEFSMPRAGEAKGRPLTTEEFERMLAAVPKVRPHDPGIWTRFLYGLWLSGLRLEEAMILSWDADAPFAVDVSGKYPGFRIEARAQKGRRTEKVPMTPDFAEWIFQTPEEDREGPVFKLPGLLDGGRLSVTRTSRIISAIGETAGVVVNKEEGKYASAHDLRRSFGTRWSQRAMPPALQRLMRHASINTTMRYYVHLEADEVAATLWKGVSEREGTILGTVEEEGA